MAFETLVLIYVIAGMWAPSTLTHSGFAEQSSDGETEALRGLSNSTRSHNEVYGRLEGGVRARFEPRRVCLHIRRV